MRKSSLNPFLAPVLVILVVGTTLYGCRSGSEEKPDRVVLVTIDTLRADHVGAYGYPLDITPFIDSLASTGYTFGTALAHSSATAPSHASIFTGLYPIQHRVTSNGLKLPPQFRTLAEAFRGAGYRTAAFTSTNAHFKWGDLHRGFDAYDEQPLSHPNRSKRLEKKGHYRTASQTIDAALEWLAQTDDSEQLFLWIHLYDPHKRLRPPEEHRDEVQRLFEKIGQDRYQKALESSHGDLADQKLHRQILLYDAEIRYVDTQLERLYQAMLSKDRSDLWIVTSDHGQGLKSHRRYFGHTKLVYNTQVLVPLILHYTNSREDPVWIRDVVAQHIDLAPTLTEIIGLDLIQPGSSAQGKSLAPHLVGSRSQPSGAYGFSQNSLFRSRSPKRPALSQPKYALQNLDFKYILHEGEPDEFYDLRSDPGELHNQLDRPDLADEKDRLLGTLVRTIATLSNSELEAESVDEETLERLKALGYLQ